MPDPAEKGKEERFDTNFIHRLVSMAFIDPKMFDKEDGLTAEEYEQFRKARKKARLDGSLVPLPDDLREYM